MSKTKQQIPNTTNSNKDLDSGNNSDSKVTAASTVSPNNNSDGPTFVTTNNDDEIPGGKKENGSKKSSPWRRRASRGAESMRSASKKKQKKATNSSSAALASSSSSLSNSKQELNSPKSPAVSVVDVNNNEIRPISPDFSSSPNNDTTNTPLNHRMTSSNSVNTSGLGSLLSQSNLSPNLTSLSLNPYVSPPQLQQQPQSSQKPKSRDNDRFHQLFPSVSLDEYVIDTYSCAYAKSLNLYQGVMFVTSNYICFYSNILNHTNILIIKFSHINSITKSMHAVIFPTAIRIETHNGVYSFTSFRSRSHTLDHLAELLQKSRQRQVNEQCMLQRNMRLMQAAAAAAKTNTSMNNGSISPSSTKSDDDASPPQSDKRRVTSFTIDTEIIESDSSSPNTTRTSNDSSHIDSGLKISASSPVIVNSSQSKPKVRDQFQIFNKDSNNPYYDYWYGQQIQTDNSFYDFDFSGLSSNKVIVSIKHRQTLPEKIKLLMSILVPGFFNISRIDALLPICFIMCVLLLLNAFVLLNKVNQVDEIFTKLLTKNDF